MAVLEKWLTKFLITCLLAFRKEPEQDIVSSAGTSLNLFGCSSDDRWLELFQFFLISIKLLWALLYSSLHKYMFIFFFGRYLTLLGDKIGISIVFLKK